MAISGTIEQFLGTEFFTYVVPWLLTFAIVYGVLSQVNIPPGKSRIQTIIAIIIAFFVLPVAAPIVATFVQMLGSMVIIIAGILVLIILAELVGTRQLYKATDETKERIDIGIIVLILAIAVFVGAGGLSLLGWQFTFGPSTKPVLFFLTVMIIAIWYMTSKD